MRNFLVLLLLTACVNHEFPNNDVATAVDRACKLCNKPISEMMWFAEIVRKADSDPGLQGNIYKARIDDQVLFIHQPAIMSCVACVVYNCNGDRVSADPALIEKIIPFFTTEHLLFSSFPN